MQSNEIYHPLNGYVKAEAPTKWDEALVFARLVESAIVIAHTTSRTKTGFGSSWPTVYHDFEDLIGRGEEHRKDVWGAWQRSRPQYDAATIDRAAEAGSWSMRYLQGKEGISRVVLAYAAARSGNIKVSAVLRRHKIPSSTARKWKRQGLALIADSLTRDRVLIREAVVSS